MPDIAEARVFARAAIAGNPSDGYGGHVLAVCIRDFSAHAEAQLADEVVLDGPADLLQAAARRLSARGISLPAGYRLKVSTTIPREVGLGGSSAIVLASMRALLQLADAQLPDDELAVTALEAETIELGIQAGLQDRIVQARGGLVGMDFEARVNTSLDPALLPPVYLAWCTHASEHSGVVHDGIRARFEAGDEDVTAAMWHLAEYARDAVASLLAGDVAGLASAIDGSFDVRASILELDPRHVAMAEAARSLGASANYAGSGGAIIGTLPTPEVLPDLEAAMSEVGATMIRPSVRG